MIRPLLIVGAAVLASPSLAQTWPAEAGATMPYDDGDARRDVGALESRPGVAAANREALAESARGGAAMRREQARHATDVANYRMALDAYRRTVARDAAIDARQERAYALAMEDWRAQVDACDRGSSRACRAPAPDPADYW